MIPCNMFGFRNVLHLMLTAILYACNLFWEFTSGSSLLASISKQYLEIVLIVLTRTLDERNFNMQIRKQAMVIKKVSLTIMTQKKLPL